MECDRVLVVDLSLPCFLSKKNRHGDKMREGQHWERLRKSGMDRVESNAFAGEAVGNALWVRRDRSFTFGFLE